MFSHERGRAEVMAAAFTKAEEVVKIAKPADLIEFDRGAYQHWAIYVGDGDIVHFASNPTASLVNKKKALIKREKLTGVTGSNACRINNRLDDKHPARDPKLVMKDALQMVGQEVPYSVFSWNCEHFVTGLRYYESESGQVEKAATAALAVGIILLFGFALLAFFREKEESDKTKKKQQQ